MYIKFFKPFIDVTGAFVLFAILSPVFLVVSLLVKLNSSGPVFYRGVRVGLHGSKFNIFKFRTMVQDAELLGGYSTALNDPRLTRIGKFLRKYKIDELPQIFNILQGDMSFVGPRPQVEHYTNMYSQEEADILNIKPGITDFSSLEYIHLDSLLGDNNVDDKYLNEIEPIKNHLRLKYVAECSFSTDCRIILNTIISLTKIR